MKTYISIPHNSTDIHIKNEETDELTCTVHNNNMELAKQIQVMLLELKKHHQKESLTIELDCPYDFTSRCTMGRCDCKPKTVL